MLYDKRWEEKQLPVVTEQEPWRQLLLRAAELIEEVGWCQGQFAKYKGGVAVGYCTLGALITLCARIRAAGTSVRDARFYAEHRLQEQVGCIVNWNDRRVSTKEEVVAKLRKVAKSE